MTSHEVSYKKYTVRQKIRIKVERFIKPVWKIVILDKSVCHIFIEQYVFYQWSTRNICHIGKMVSEQVGTGRMGSFVTQLS
mgnify:CR=1 FL=1